MTNFTFEKGKSYQSSITGMVYEFYSKVDDRYYFINLSKSGKPDISGHTNQEFLGSLEKVIDGDVFIGINGTLIKLRDLK